MNDPNNKPRGKKIIWLILFSVSLATFLASLVVLIIHLWPEEENFSEYKTSSDITLASNPIDFDALQAENPEVCAWIRIDGMSIDYPILQSGPDRDEDFYLYRDIYGETKRAGSIYIQKLNNKDFSDKNTVIYGHNMANGTMFGKLNEYRKREFFDEHRDIYIYTPGHILHYRVLSSFIYDDRHILNSFNFNDEDGFIAFLSECLAPKSLTRQVADDITASTDDKLITLSTCTNINDQRELIVAVLLEDTPTK